LRLENVRFEQRRKGRLESGQKAKSGP
jgi:hypothetical protein